MASSPNLVVEGGPPIASEAHLLRSFHPSFVAEDIEGKKRPASRAFNSITDSETEVHAMSVYRTDLLDEASVSYDEIIAEHPNHLIVSLPAQTYADLGLELVAAPEDGVIGPAHMHVTGKLTQARKNRLVEAVMNGPGRWVKGP
jgi:hypothetical protein